MNLVVAAIATDDVGGIALRLESNEVLEVFPDDTYALEYWRLFEPVTELEHFVVTPHGVEKHGVEE